MVHVDETPVQMLAPGSKKTHRAYAWAYATTSAADIKAVVYDFSPGRSGEYARNFLGDWKGKLVCDDYGGYKASFALGVTKIGCMAHARRKFYKLHVTKKASSRSRRCSTSLLYTRLSAKLETWSLMSGDEYAKKKQPR